MQANDDRSRQRGGSSAPGLPMSRRAMFCRIGGGFGALGLGSVLADAGLCWSPADSAAMRPGDAEASVPGNPLAPGRRISRRGPSG